MHPGTQTSPPLELWGGMECTVNRVGETYFDQTRRSGHQERLSDLDLVAGLGLKALRYPVLWERTAPDGVDRADWRWLDERLGRLQALGVRPIAGLVHHGSGPQHTSLVQPSFVQGLATYARAVAARYPWIQEYTPVNEPLTTARFSGLYGHWYPHGRDERTFFSVLLTQCRATVEAMAAIREVNPLAKLVATDDLGKVYSTPRLAYQAAYENERRWLGWDLLCGMLDREHPMWAYLVWAGVPEADLAWFLDHPCPPDVIGINHYLTSERLLDEAADLYRDDLRGGNDRERYADIEAVRVRVEGTGGWRVLVREAWERYHLPLALTEVHLGCTREEQMRWLLEAWRTCEELRLDGVDIRAVAAWSLFGAFDWNTLVTADRGFYEPGVFDIRGPRPRATGIAGLMRQLGRGARPDHPVLVTPGWWKRAERFTYRPVWTEAPAGRVARRQHGPAERERPIVITGATGTLGRAFARVCRVRGLAYRLLSRGQLDIADPGSVAHALDQHRPWAVVNTAGFVRVDEAERRHEVCLRENATGPAVLAAACADREVRLATFSSDLVFDGSSSRPYVERDSVNPMSVYGRSKVEAERRVLASLPSALVIRTSAFFGPWDEHNFVLEALRTLANGDSFEAPSDGIVSPTYVPDLVNASLDLLVDGESGIWHLANDGQTSWAALARRAALLAGVSSRSLRPRRAAELQLVAQRPRFSALASERAWIMPSLEDALARFVRECELGWLPASGDVTRAA